GGTWRLRHPPARRHQPAYRAGTAGARTRLACRPPAGPAPRQPLLVVLALRQAARTAAGGVFEWLPQPFRASASGYRRALRHPRRAGLEYGGVGGPELRNQRRGRAALPARTPAATAPLLAPV